MDASTDGSNPLFPLMPTHILKINSEQWDLLKGLKSKSSWRNMNDFLLQDVIRPFLEGNTKMLGSVSERTILAIQVRIADIEETLKQLVKGKVGSEVAAAVDEFARLNPEEDEADVDPLEIDFDQLESMSFIELEPIANTFGVKGRTTRDLISGIREFMEREDTDLQFQDDEPEYD